MKDTSVWSAVLKSISKELPSAEVDRWLRPLYISEIKNGMIELTAPNKFYKTWVEDNYFKLIEKVLKDDIQMSNSDNALVIKIVVDGEKGDAKVQQAVAPVQEVVSKPRVNYNHMQLNQDMTFDNFVVGDSNRMAHGFCVGAANGLDSISNPLYIYGDVGLGKTHLMQAIGNKLRMDYAKLSIIYTTGESYTNEFINSLKNRDELEKFKERYNCADVLLFDDVQSLGGDKNKTREEFFNTFNILFNNRKRIIITSNCVPSSLPTEIDKRITSRFSSGMMIDISSPSSEEKEAIIRKRLDMMDFYISPEITRFLAENIKTDNVRELLGVLTTLVTYAQLDNDGHVTQEFTERVLKAHLVKRDKVLTPDDIIKVVLEFFRLKQSDLTSSSRSHNLVYARSIAMYLVREKTQLSYIELGNLFNRNHSTVLSAVNKIDAEKNEPSTKGVLDDLRNKMKLAIN